MYSRSPLLNFEDLDDAKPLSNYCFKDCFAQVISMFTTIHFTLLMEGDKFPNELLTSIHSVIEFAGHTDNSARVLALHIGFSLLTTWDFDLGCDAFTVFFGVKNQCQYEIPADGQPAYFLPTYLSSPQV